MESEAGDSDARSLWARGVVEFGLAGALVIVVPSGVSAVPARGRCRAIAFVANEGSGTASTIDVKTRTKNPAAIGVGTNPFGVAVTPDGKTAFVTNLGAPPAGSVGGTVSTIDVKTRTKDPTDIAVEGGPLRVAITPCRR